MAIGSSTIVSPAIYQLRPPLLEGFTRAEYATILGPASQRSVPERSVIVTQGEPADYLFLITKGCARYFYVTAEGKKLVFFWLSQGQVFGAASLLSASSEYLVGTETTKDTSLLVWHRTAIRALALRFPRLLDNALSIASDYLTWYVASHASLVCHSAPERLARTLVTLAQGLGRRTPGGICLEITNEQLADTANVSPFTASHILNEWQQLGAIVKSRGRVLVRRPEQLVMARGA